MNINQSVILKLLSYCLLFMSPLFSFSQKLPAVQLKSLRIPSNFIIDGKADEWNNSLQAHNKNTDILYTIANDDVNIYLVIQTISPSIIYKVIKGGITLTVNPTAKKFNGSIKSITFPVISENGKSVILQTLGKAQPILYTSNYSLSSKDSITKVLNHQLLTYSKEIRISGIKTIADTSISIYNKNGVKSIGLFNNTCVLTYEFLIPLSALDLSIEGPGKFYYNVKLNGQSSVVASGLSSDGLAVVSTERRSNTSLSSESEFPTFFWADYKLIK